MVGRFAVLGTGAFATVFFVDRFVVAFAAAFVVTGAFLGEFLVLAFVPASRFDVFDAKAGVAVVTRFAALPVAFGLPSAPRVRPTTLSVPGPGTKLDSSPDGQRTLSMFPRTSVTTPRRGTCPTFVAANSIWSPTAGTRPSLRRFLR